MSELAVTVERARNVRKHPNADSLMLVDVLGWTCVTRPGVQDGDLVIYFPIDAVLPAHLEQHIFGMTAKVKLHSGRVRTVKIRGEYSQGLAIPLAEARTWPELCPPNLAFGTAFVDGMNLTTVLGVTKHAAVPPKDYADKGQQQRAGVSMTFDIPRYTDLQHLAKHPESFALGERVAVTEKLHGTSARYGCVRPTPRTWWRKALSWVGIGRGYAFVYGSRNVDYTDWQTPGSGGVWGAIARRLELATSGAIQPGEVVYGEIVGEGVQKHYAYGAPDRTGFGKDFYVYDVLVDVGTARERWLGHDELLVWCAMRKLHMVPTLYVGPYTAALIADLASGASVLDPDTKVREGCVVRSVATPNAPRTVYKVVSREFLVRNAESGTEDDELADADASKGGAQ